jgi:hypothetical protein
LSNLDQLYGEPRTPAYVGPFERRRQASWLLLDTAGGRDLKAYLEHACGEAYLARHFCDGFNTLWLIDTDGHIRIAIEEMAILDAPTFVSVPMPNAVRNNAIKLGHPSLVEGDVARIGGELTLLTATGTYYISNKSGRFGSGRSRDHLENAAKLFVAKGIEVTTSYLPGVL